MLRKIKEFANNTASGSMYLFTKEDFQMLQAWIFWMVLNHEHTHTAYQTGSSPYSQGILASNVKMHQVGTHPTTAVPLGFKQQLNSSGSAWELHKIDSGVDTLINRTYLTLEDHVAHKEIHSISGGPQPVPAAEGQLVARGWTKPIFVRAVVSSPLFEIAGYTMRGPVIMPFPHHNVSPISADVHNTRNQTNVSASYPTQVPMTRLSSRIENDATFQDKGYFDKDLALSQPEGTGNDDDGSIYVKGGFRAFEPESLMGFYPYPEDAKSHVHSPFYNIAQQFLYLIPPYLETELNIDLDFDVVDGQDASVPVSIFYHTPLFVDSKHTKLLDRISRSGITADEILNHKDLTGIFLKDIQKTDFFGSPTETSRTCWLSKYAPVLVKDQNSGTGYGCSLVFKEFDQEINQFISQINYSGSYMKRSGSDYYDYPFKIVTMNFNVYGDPMDDPRLNAVVPVVTNGSDEVDEEQTHRDINEFFAARGFPRCTYLTDFDSFLSRAGGNQDERNRPKEDFWFSVYPSAVWRMKRHIKEWLYKDVDAYYFDILNVPQGFTNGSRQVLILKDSDIYRADNLFQRNPFSNLRLQGYMVVEGYVTVPYEAYATPFSVEDAMGVGSIAKAETNEGNSGDNWQNTPPDDYVNFVIPPPVVKGGTGTNVTVLPPGSGGLPVDNGHNPGGNPPPAEDPIVINPPREDSGGGTTDPPPPQPPLDSGLGNDGGGTTTGDGTGTGPGTGNGPGTGTGSGTTTGGGTSVGVGLVS